MVSRGYGLLHQIHVFPKSITLNESIHQYESSLFKIPVIFDFPLAKAPIIKALFVKLLLPGIVTEPSILFLLGETTTIFTPDNGVQGLRAFTSNSRFSKIYLSL